MNIDYLTSLHSIEERLKNGKAKTLYYDKENDPRLKPLITLAQKKRILCQCISREELKKMGAFHMALAIEMENKGGIEWFKKRLDKLAQTEKALVLVLDGITDPHNLGAILRSSAQFGVSLVVYGERRSAQGDTDTVARTSAGATELVSHGFVPNISNALTSLKQAGFWVYGTTMQGDPLHTTQFSPKSVVVMGAEGKGLSVLVQKKCDQKLTIATTSKLDSLNVSVATGIVLYQWYCT